MSSVALFITITVLTSLQLFGFGFQFAFFICLIARGMYLGRLVGIQIPIGYILACEGGSFFWLIVKPILLQRQFNKLEFIIYLLIFALVALVEVYVENDCIYEDISEEEYEERLYKTRVLEEESYGRVTSKNRKGNRKTRGHNKH